MITHFNEWASESHTHSHANFYQLSNRNGSCCVKKNIFWRIFVLLPSDICFLIFIRDSIFWWIYHFIVPQTIGVNLKQIQIHTKNKVNKTNCQRDEQPEKASKKNKRTANATSTSINREHSVESVQDTTELHNIWQMILAWRNNYDR